MLAILLTLTFTPSSTGYKSSYLPSLQFSSPFKNSLQYQESIFEDSANITIKNPDKINLYSNFSFEVEPSTALLVNIQDKKSQIEKNICVQNDLIYKVNENVFRVNDNYYSNLKNIKVYDKNNVDYKLKLEDFSKNNEKNEALNTCTSIVEGADPFFQSSNKSFIVSVQPKSKAKTSLDGIKNIVPDLESISYAEWNNFDNLMNNIKY